MPTVRIELNRAGIGELLRSDDVQRMLDEKAERVADAARGRGIRVGWQDDQPLPIVVEEARGARARALVIADHEAGLRVEAKHRLLVSSLDAAR